MTQRKAFLTKEQSLMLRGIAIFLVLISHYAVWIGEIFHSDLLEYGLGRFGVYGVDLFFALGLGPAFLFGCGGAAHPCAGRNIFVETF